MKFSILILIAAVCIVGCEKQTKPAADPSTGVSSERSQTIPGQKNAPQEPNSPGTEKNRKKELLLLGAEPVPDPVAAGGADNSRCHACHANYKREKLCVTHAVANVGCETCHGPSDKHCSDEDNITPPDRMYAKEKINAACLVCHAAGDLSSLCKSVLEGAAKEKTCTDCHGKEHKLNFRTRKWDKNTGKLLEDDKVRMGF